MAVDFFFGCEGTGCPDSDENQEIQLCFLHAVMFSFCFNIAASMATCTELHESFEKQCAI